VGFFWGVLRLGVRPSFVAMAVAGVSVAYSWLKENFTMIERTFTVLNKMGLHARPAAAMVTALQKFDSDVFASQGRPRGGRKKHYGDPDPDGRIRIKIDHPGGRAGRTGVMDNMTNSLTIRYTRNSPMASNLTPPETRVFKGISASPGIAIGKAFVLEDMDLAVGRWQVPPKP
jgi:hypothetical protein